MSSVEYLYDFIKKFIPKGGEVLMLADPYKGPAMIMADLDGDGTKEIVTAYKYQDEIFLIVLKNQYGIWKLAGTIKGKGYNITYLGVAPVTKRNSRDLIVGWQIGAIWSILGIYEWIGNEFKSLLKEDFYFSKIQVGNLIGEMNNKQKVEIALWSHFTGEAYDVQIYRWQDGELVIAQSAYKHYFKKVVEYYKKKLKENPEILFYWYFLADAQIKVKEYEDAINSINRALESPYPFPSKNKLLRLKKEIEKKILCRFEKLYPTSLKTIEGTRWGYINSRGDFVIKPNFDYAMDFQNNGLAVVEINNLQGLINENGDFIVDPIYESITEFSEGRGTIIDDEGFKVIDESGKILTTKAYEFIGTYKNGRALVADSNKEGKYLYGYLDMQGKEVIPLQYESAIDFMNGRTVVKIKDNEYEVIDINGNALFKYNYSYVGGMNGGMLVFQPIGSDKYGYIDYQGNTVISPQFTWATNFKDGRAVVNASENFINKIGLIDSKGNFVIEPIYNDINLLDEDRVAVGRALDEEKPYMGSIYALGDVNGNLVTEFIYYNISNFNNGLASVSDGKNTFFIDVNGTVQKDLPIVKGNGTLTKEGNIIKGNIDLKTFYLNDTGEVLWSQNTVIPLNDPYEVVEEKYKPNKDYLVYYPQIEGMEDEKAEKNVNEVLKQLAAIKTVDEDKQLEYSYTGDFSVEFYKGKLLVLNLNGYEFYFGAAHGMPTEVYPHINLETGRVYQLKDLFKENSNYVQVISNIIAQQIKNMGENSYIFPDTYKGISEEQPFYVDESNLYIYFAPYEIAAFAAGFPTFKIPYADIMNIINTEGEFWSAFH